MTNLNARLLQFSSDELITPSQIATGKGDALDIDEKIVNFHRELNIGGMILDMEGYHRRFLGSRPKQYLINYIGDLSILDSPTISIVGPRLPSMYAKEMVEELISNISSHQVVTVSGGAKGIDSLVHRLSLKHKIPTIVVLGGGFGYYYKSRKWSSLLEVVENGGLLISQFKTFQEPSKITFPQRNGVIATLGDKLFVPAAGVKSGSLITVDFALNMNKDVYSVPCNLGDSSGEGTNEYLAEAKVNFVTDISEFVEDNYGRQLQQPLFESIGLDKSQSMLVDLISNHPDIPIDKLQDYCELNFQEILVGLSQLEAMGVVRESMPTIYEIV